MRTKRARSKPSALPVAVDTRVLGQLMQLPVTDHLSNLIGREAALGAAALGRVRAASLALLASHQAALSLRRHLGVLLLRLLLGAQNLDLHLPCRNMGCKHMIWARSAFVARDRDRPFSGVHNASWVMHRACFQSTG